MIVDEVGNGRREAKQRRKCVGKRKGEVKAAANDGRDGVLAQVVCQCGSNGTEAIQGETAMRNQRQN